MMSDLDARVGRTRHGRGQALVEFALILFSVVIVLFGLLDIGRLVYVNNSLTQGAREGARWGSVQGRSQTPSAIEAYTLGIMAAVPDATVIVSCTSPIGLPVTNSNCVSNSILVVQVSSQVTMFTPLISALVGVRTYSATTKVTVNQ